MYKSDLPDAQIYLISSSRKEIIEYTIHRHFGRTCFFSFHTPIYGEPKSGRVISNLKLDDSVEFSRCMTAKELSEELIRLSRDPKVARYDPPFPTNHLRHKGWVLYKAHLNGEDILIAWAEWVGS